MNAKYERRSYSGNEEVWVGKYRKLRNIPHWHLEHELIICLEGAARIINGDAVYTASAGDCVFCQSGNVHSVSAEDGCTLLVCLFNEKLTAALTDEFELSQPLFRDRYQASERLAEIRLELGWKRAFFVQKVSAMIIALISDIFRGEELKNRCRKSAAENPYKDLLYYIDTEFDSITFADAARFMNFSEPYFSGYFKRQSGMTFSQYMNAVRVEKAVELLNNCSRGAVKSVEIMLRCGFGTLRSFNRAFKEVTGYTPMTLPSGYVLNLRSLPSTQSINDPTLETSVLLRE